MRKVQLLGVLVVLLAGAGYVVYQKLTENVEVSYKTTSGFQQYNTDAMPKELFFAGEKVPLKNKAVANRILQELKIQTSQNPNMALLVAKANYWLPLLDTVLRKYNIPQDFKYLAVAESNLENVQSERAAGGFWQLLPETATELGLEINNEVDERYHPVKSTEAACKYIRQAYQYFDSWASVAAAYNSGISYMLYHQQNQQKASVYELQLNPQTGGYLYRVLAFKQLLEHQKEYGYDVKDKPFRSQPETEITITRSLPSLRAFALSRKVSFYTLLLYNPWLKSNSLTIRKKGKTYTLLLPEKTKGS